jgi:hypothetical protein
LFVLYISEGKIDCELGGSRESVARQTGNRTSFLLVQVRRDRNPS